MTMRMRLAASAFGAVGPVVAASVISPSTKAGTRSGMLLKQYLLLGAADQLLGLSKLGLATAYPTMTKPFNL